MGDFAYLVLIASLFIGCICTAIIYWVGKNKEKDYDLQLGKVHREVAEANAKAAEANRIAEAERLARIQIEQKIAPRFITGEEQNKIIDQIKQFAPQRFEIITYRDDKEAFGLADIIKQTLEASGWDYLISDEFIASFMKIELGVIVEFSTKDVIEAANNLSNALNDIGMLSTVIENSNVSNLNGKIRIRVGKKP